MSAFVPEPPEPSAVVAPAATPDAWAVRATELTVRYQPERPPVLTAQNIAIPAGKISVFIGPNGSGKSTLLKALARQLRPDHGQVILHGREIATLTPRELARELGILFQENIAPGDLTVEELAYHGRYPYLSFFAQPGADDRAAVAQALRLSGAEPLKEKRVSELSSGQRQLAWIALLLAQSPRCLFLDEPTTFLDLAHQFAVLDRVRVLNRELGCTVVLSIHDLNLAARYADRIFALRNGEIIAAGTPVEVLTPETLRTVFTVDAKIIPDPDTGTVFCLPLGRSADAD